MLGVDEHTACLVDLEAGTVSVSGLGCLTVRVAGQSARVGAGQSLGLDELVALARSLADASSGAPARPERATVVDGATAPASAGPPATQPVQPAGARTDPFLDEVRRLSSAFDQAMAGRDAGAAVDAVLALEDVLHAWSSDTAQSDNVDRAGVPCAACWPGWAGPPPLACASLAPWSSRGCQLCWTSERRPGRPSGFPTATASGTS